MPLDRRIVVQTWVSRIFTVVVLALGAAPWMLRAEISLVECFVICFLLAVILVTTWLRERMFVALSAAQYSYEQMQRWALLENLYREVRWITVQHREDAQGRACVAVSDLAKALEKIDPQWYADFRSR